MCIVNNGLKVYFQTDKTFEKIKNIKENKNIAFNIGAYNCKGIARIAGEPYENKEYIELIKQKHYKIHKSYTLLDNEVINEADKIECKFEEVNSEIDN